MFDNKFRAHVCFTKGVVHLHILKEIKEIFDFSNDRCVHMLNQTEDLLL